MEICRYFDNLDAKTTLKDKKTLGIKLKNYEEVIAIVNGPWVDEYEGPPTFQILKAKSLELVQNLPENVNLLTLMNNLIEE